MSRIGITAFVAIALCATCAFAEQKITIGKGASKTVDPGFQVEKYDAGRDGILSVDVSGGAVRITGVAEGTGVLRLIGVGGLEETYEVTVGSDLVRIMRDLQQRLESVTGIEIVKQETRLLVRGEINDPGEWFRMKKILAEDDYKPYVRDDTEFRIQADTRKRFYDEIKAAGFELASNIADTERGALYINDAHNVITISGTVYAPESLEKLKQIVRAQSWIRDADSPSSGADEDWKPTCRLNITLDQRLLHMDVVLIGYEEDESFSYGKSNNELPIISGAFNALIDLVHGRSKNSAFALSANIDDTLDFLAKNHISRHSTGGYLRFRSNDPQPNRLKIGGVFKIKLRSATAEGNPTEDFKDIDYGFTVDKKVANLVNADTVHIQLDIKQENPVPFSPEAGGYEEGYNVHQYEYNPVLDCPLGKTMVIGGYRKMVETSTPSSGFPILRHVPIVNWFIAKEGNLVENMQLMMLVSVRAVRPDEPEAQETKLPYEESKNLPKEIEISNEDRLESRKRFHGFWYWLNWFVP